MGKTIGRMRVTHKNEVSSVLDDRSTAGSFSTSPLSRKGTSLTSQSHSKSEWSWIDTSRDHLPFPHKIGRRLHPFPSIQKPEMEEGRHDVAKEVSQIPIIRECV